jgi:hypothetical protein
MHFFVFLLSLSSDTENGDIFLRNVWLYPNIQWLNPENLTLHSHRSDDLKYNIIIFRCIQNRLRVQGIVKLIKIYNSLIFIYNVYRKYSQHD